MNANDHTNYHTRLTNKVEHAMLDLPMSTEKKCMSYETFDIYSKVIDWITRNCDLDAKKDFGYITMKIFKKTYLELDCYYFKSLFKNVDNNSDHWDFDFYFLPFLSNQDVDGLLVVNYSRKGNIKGIQFQ